MEEFSIEDEVTEILEELSERYASEIDQAERNLAER